jgi:RNA polymerase sigma-70 factor (ECF subfamily)
MESVLPQTAGRVSPQSATGTAGELADFDSVARAYQPGIFRFVLASLRDCDAAETITQECLLKAYRARTEFRGEASIRSWLTRIAINLVRNHLRDARLKFWRRTQRLGVDSSIAANWLADSRSSPEASVQTKQRIDAVWNAVADLPEKQRTVFLLRFGEDMDPVEIAAAVGTGEATVRVHLFRALNTVRKRMEQSQ